ncbi:M23 family metallopeptidase [Stenotrophomonas panacihumi]|nr:M23 family metallopeptidase [Stenotrophomonas panacihumi]PTN53192.1 M23 family peptidase [Stenotrophomonas panacihumi]
MSRRPFFLLALLLVPMTVPAQRLLHWNAPTAPARPMAEGSWLRLAPAGGGYVAWVDNPLPGPAQVRLRAGSAEGYESVPALPTAAVLSAGERRAVAHLYRVGGDAARLGLAVDAIPGDPRALPDGQVLRLPFDGAPIRVDQGYDGAFSHHDDANRYALDFALPEGTPILAAREGTVLQVEAGYREGGDDHALPANLVRILHRDGSMAVYAHLSADGLAVRPGQWVKAGERIALSGQTGYSTGPHLHFAVQVNAGMRLAAIPFRMAGPLGELHLPRTGPAPAAAP